jgi:hypothetical protein
MVLDRCPCTECLGILKGTSRWTIYRHIKLQGEATAYELREAEIRRAAAAATAAGKPIPTGPVEDRSANDFPLESTNTFYRHRRGVECVIIFGGNRIKTGTQGTEERHSSGHHTMGRPPPPIFSRWRLCTFVSLLISRLR